MINEYNSPLSRVKQAVHRVSFFALFCLLSCLAEAQDYQVRHRKITVREGLSNNRITSIDQDKNGYMWFGSAYGLNRFDGYQCQVFLKNQNIHDLEVATDSTLYLVTDSGFYVYNFITHREQLVFDAAPIGRITHFSSDTFLLSNSGEVYTWSPKAEVKEVFTIKPLIRPNEMSDTYFRDLKVDREKRIWITATRGGILQLNQNFELVKQHPLGYWATEVNCFDNQILVSNEGNSFYYDAPSESFIAAPIQQMPFISEPKKELPPLYPNQVQADPNGFLWFNSGNHKALWAYDFELQSFFSFNLEGFDARQNLKFFNDINGNLWIATDDGLLVLEIQRNTISNYLNDANKNPGKVASIRGITELSDHDLYISSYAGVFVLNAARDSIRRLINQAPDSLTHMPDNRCFELLADNDCFWCASESFGLLKYQLDQQFFKRIGADGVTYNDVKVMLAYFIEVGYMHTSSYLNYFFAGKESDLTAFDGALQVIHETLEVHIQDRAVLINNFVTFIKNAAKGLKEKEAVA